VTKSPNQEHGTAPGDDHDEGSVTLIIRQMQKGDGNGAEQLWQRFYVRLKYLMKDRLRDQLHQVADEEDVALESLAEMFRGLVEGKYPSLDSRESFWRLLVTVASRNVLDEINRENRQKRGSGRVYHESAFSSPSDDSTALFEQIASSTQAPDVQLMITERCTSLLESLTDKSLQAIALMKTSGATNQEVADSLQIGLRSVERKLAEIRSRWKNTQH
jgi:RNA polymerase sigma factor (sigma-70 family)